MHIVSMTKFIAGLVFLAVALIVLVPAIRERGFGKYRQLTALGLAAAGIFIARGLGLVNF